MLRLCLLELDILFFAHAAAFASWNGCIQAGGKSKNQNPHFKKRHRQLRQE